MVGGFFHYWFHRLAHESRLLWLLFHRTHHMTPELIQPSTQAVFNAFPFFLFAAVPYVVIFTVIGKLLTNESVLIYLVVFKLLSAFSNLFSHQTALYDWAQRKWYIRVLNTITSEGVYHYLHHSSESQHNQPRGNLVNIGGRFVLFLGSRVRHLSDSNRSPPRCWPAGHRAIRDDWQPSASGNRRPCPDCLMN